MFVGASDLIIKFHTCLFTDDKIFKKYSKKRVKDSDQ